MSYGHRLLASPMIYSMSINTAFVFEKPTKILILNKRPPHILNNMLICRLSFYSQFGTALSLDQLLTDDD